MVNLLIHASLARTLALITALGLDSKKVPYTYIAGEEPAMYNFSSDPPASVLETLLQSK